MKTLLYNGEVFTVNKSDDMASAVLMDGNKILYVGSDEEALRLCDEETEKIDVNGKSVLPGFIESHIHLNSRVGFARGINLSRKAGITDINALKERLKKEAESVKPGEWIIAYSFTFEDLDEKRWPTRYELDEVCSDIPVAITHSSAHTGLYNTKALELTHVLDGKGGYPEEHVLKDENGVPNGVLKETAHFKCSEEVTKFNPVSEEMLKQCLRDITADLNKVGVTSAHDAGGTGTTLINAMQKEAMAGNLTCRMYPMLFSIQSKEDNVEFVNAQLRSGFFTGLGNDYMRIGPIKIMVDGSGASGTCATREPISHNGAMMPSSYTQEEIDDFVLRSQKAGFQFTAHAIGDRGVEMLLDAYDKAQKEYPRTDTRHRIEHCMIAEPDLLDRIAELKLIPTLNPGFINIWGSVFNKYYQGNRQNYLIALRSAIDKGIVCTIASDWACSTNIAPLTGIASAMDRTIYETGEKVSESQAITLKEAIRCVTYNAAYSEFSEDVKGSLETGKLADVIVVDGTLSKLSPEEIYKTDISRTYFDGKLVYKK